MAFLSIAFPHLSDSPSPLVPRSLSPCLHSASGAVQATQFQNKDRIKICTETVQPSTTRTNHITSKSALHTLHAFCRRQTLTSSTGATRNAAVSSSEDENNFPSTRRTGNRNISSDSSNGQGVN
jgi:hypothetical protein